MDRVEILGVPVDNVTQAEVLDRISGFVEDAGPHQIVTVNPEFVMAAQEDPEFAGVLRAAHLALPDGIGLVWASRLLDRPIKSRVTGVDTVLELAGAAAARGWRLFLLGAAEDVAERASEVLQKRHPSLQVVGALAGSPSPDDEERIAEAVRASQPHVLLVAFGAPTQDLWIARNLARLGVPVAMGVGGSFDFIAGLAPRAPRWMQRLGLEWLHRLIQEPWRWRRMLALPRFAGRVLFQAARRG